MSRILSPARPSRPADRARRVWLLPALLLMAAASPQAGVPAGGDYSLRKEVIASGGSAGSGGPYTLVGTVGQSVVGPTGSGAIQLQQGFHAGTARQDEIFSNGFE